MENNKEVINSNTVYKLGTPHPPTDNHDVISNSTKIPKDRLSKFLLLEQSGALFTMKKNPLDKKEKLKFKLIKSTQITHDTYIYRYELPKGETLGLNMGEHLTIEANIVSEEFPDGEEVVRKYTPTTWITQTDYFDLLIKIYFKNVHPQFPNGGKLSQYIYNMKLGDYIVSKGPIWKSRYLGDGFFETMTQLEPRLTQYRFFKKVLFIAGGTGITPIYQMISGMHLNEDKTEVILLYGNKTTKDFLLKEELDAIEKEGKIKIKIVYTIDNAEEGWNGEVGYITKNMISKYVDFSSVNETNDMIYLSCGPGPMNKSIPPILKELGANVDNYFKL